MRHSLAEQTLSRILAYLDGLGVEPTREVMQDALALVAEAIERIPSVGSPDEAELFEAVMERLPQHFSLPEPLLPPATPPLARGSIHYRKSR